MHGTGNAGGCEAISRLSLLIPAWEPDPELLELVKALLSLGFGAVIVVDDGSGQRCQETFARLTRLPRVKVLRHNVNLGKGRSLKTGINYVLTELPGHTGLVTADADGQHRVEDITSVAKALLSANGRVVLGSRDFAKDVPLRSKFGNTMTRYIFGFVTGAKLRDTQTGLRGFPQAILPELLVLHGERYEYEMTVLAHICRTRSKPLEVPIETVYIDNNRGSHFDPVRDSMRIYFVLARFFASSIIASGVDFLGFSVTFAATHHVLASVVIGRLSSLVNFALNKRFVFHNRGSLQSTLWRYYVLVALVGGLSYGLILVLTRYLGWNVFASKVLVDVLLSLVSFSVQRTFVFRKPQDV